MYRNEYNKAVIAVTYNGYDNVLHYEVKCLFCGNIFDSYSMKSRYCTDRCKGDAFIEWRRKRGAKKRAKASKCAVCATPLQQDWGKIRIYCSNACKQKAYRKRRDACECI